MTIKSNNLEELFIYLNEYEVKCITLSYIDLTGKYRSISLPFHLVDKDIFIHGFSMKNTYLSKKELSNVPNLKLLPHIDSLFIEQFSTIPTAIFICSILDEKSTIHNLDTRNSILRLQNLLETKKISPKIKVGFELRCQIFDSINYSVKDKESFCQINTKNKNNNIDINNEYNDDLLDIRNDIVHDAQTVGINILSHYKDLGYNQCCFNVDHTDIHNSLDSIYILKNIIHKRSLTYNKSATFMPNTIKNTKTNNIAYRHSLYDQNGENIFKNEELYKNYIMGIMNHVKSLNAICNSNINSYKTLHKNNNYINIVLDDNMKKKDVFIEVIFADSISNPYLSLSSIIMAGLYGIENKLQTKDLTLEDISLANNLNESIIDLENNHQFLLKGKVFDEEIIHYFIKEKKEEIYDIESTIHPIEFKKYYTE